MEKPINLIDTSICPKCKTSDNTCLTYDGQNSYFECMECKSKWNI